MRGPEELHEAIALIQHKRKMAVPRMSHARAAELARQLGGGSFSTSTWTKIESGSYDPPVDRIVIMALVVGVTADELDRIGYAEGAHLLREEVQRRAQSDPALAGVDATSTPEAVLQLILQGLEEIRGHPGLTPDQKKAVEGSLIRAVLQTVTTQIDHIRTVLDASHERSPEKRQ